MRFQALLAALSVTLYMLGQLVKHVICDMLVSWFSQCLQNLHTYPTEYGFVKLLLSLGVCWLNRCMITHHSFSSVTLQWPAEGYGLP